MIATGSDVARLPGIEIDEKRIVSSTGALALDKVPSHLIVVGAGVIGLELGSVWRRLGVESDGGRIPRPRPARHGRRGAPAGQRMLEKQGIDVQAVVQGDGGRRAGKTLKVGVEPAKGGAAETIDADVVLVAIGRVPYTEGLGLEGGRRASWTSAGASSTDAHFAHERAAASTPSATRSPGRCWRTRRKTRASPSPKSCRARPGT